LRQLLDERVGLIGVAAAEYRPLLRLDEAELVLVLPAAAELGAVTVVDKRENAATTGDAAGGRLRPCRGRRICSACWMEGLSARRTG
jgi:hypothetical protein